MARKSLSQILHEVSSDLTIIPGGVRTHVRGKRTLKLDEVSHIAAFVYIPHRATEEDWNKSGGLKCPRCNDDCVRLISIGLTGKIKMCLNCLERRRRLLNHRRHLIDIRFGNLRPKVVSGKTTS